MSFDAYSRVSKDFLSYLVSVTRDYVYYFDVKKNRKISGQGSKANTSQKNLQIAALTVLMIGLFVAWLVGFLLPAEVTNSDLAIFGGKGTYTFASYLVQPLKLAGSVQSTFNWFFFFLVFAPALISSAILFSGAEVCGAVARRTRTRTASSSSASDGGQEF